MFENALHDFFGISPEHITAVKGGWSARAYRVDTPDAAYFLKAYDRSLPSVQPWIKRIDDYIPVLGWLSETPELCGRVVKPVKGRGGEYKTEADGHVLLLFAYVPGETPGDEGLTVTQAAELAETLALLHGFDAGVPCGTQGLDEDTSLDFCEKLAEYLDGSGGCQELSALVRGETALLRTAIEKTIHLRDTVRLNAQSLVLCHADAHRFNVLQSNRLVLADWEDLRLAPAEADLFMHMNAPYWDAFLNAYKSVRPDFQINAELLYFYRLRRLLEDIWVDVARVLYDQPETYDRVSLFGVLKQCIRETREMIAK